MSDCKPKEYSRPYFLLCEGEGDKRFFDQMLNVLGISNLFHVEFPDRGGDATGGRSKFGSTLSLRLSSSPTFREKIKAVLIISDNDVDPKTSWQEVLTQINKTNGFPQPSSPGTVSKKPGYPHMVVLMIPEDQPGNLETLCLKAAYTKWPIETAVNGYLATTPAKGWTIGKQDKMKLQVVIAATCEGRPEAGFVGHWREKPDYHIPIWPQPCFQQIGDFLRNFPELVES